MTEIWIVVEYTGFIFRLVALIVVNLGLAYNIITEKFFAILVLM